MKISGSANLEHSPEKVFAALNDPAVLARTLPGCESLEQIGASTYKMVISAGVAAIKGSYLGEVELADQVTPTSFTLRAKGAGAPGTIQADVKVNLAAEGTGTLLTYDADAVVGGVIAGVGQRVLAGVAKKTAMEFFKSVNKYLSAGTTEERSESAAPEVPTANVRAPERTYSADAGTRQVGTSSASNLPSMLVGAGVALIGVIVGWLVSH